MTINYQLSRFTLYLMLVDQDTGKGITADIVAHSADFALNTIPRASCYLSLGRQANNVLKIASPHIVGATVGGVTFNKMLKAFVYLNPQGKHASNPQSGAVKRNADDVLVFEGWLTGVGYDKQAGNVRLVANLTHWLSDLHFSSSLSSMSHPQNPFQFTFRATSTNMGAGARSPQSSFISMTNGYSLLNSANITTDLWGEAIKPYLASIASFDHIQLSGDIGTVCNVPVDERGNKDALLALARIEGVSSSSDPDVQSANLALSPTTPTLPLLIPAGFSGEIASAIALSIAQGQAESWAYSTFWDKLIGSFGPQFMFSLSPQIERAIVVPFIPGLRDMYLTEVMANEYFHVDLPAFVPRPMRAVGIIAHTTWRAAKNYSSLDGSPVPRVGIGGCFSPPNAKGTILLKAAPRWLESIPVGGKPSTSTGLPNKAASGSATTPPDNVQPPAANTPTQLAVAASDIIGNLAHAYYVIEALRGRRGFVSGKLRFDICPGSTIHIQGSQDRFIGSKDQFAQDLVASVVGVSHSITAEPPGGGTVLQLADFRTLTENASDLTSIASHPLYSTKFLGAPLNNQLANTTF